MGELIFIRHGQASFGDGDYDVLSDLGREQSALTAQYLLQLGWHFDRVYSGNLNRQVDTAKIVLEYLRANSVELPLLEQIAGFNEYQFEGVMQHYIPLVAQEDIDLLPHVEKLFTDKRSFQMVFDRAINRWLTDELDIEGIEGWNSFKERVGNAITGVISENHKTSRILIFSSGGVISAAVHIATGMSPYQSIRTGWGLANTSITKFRYGSSGLVLHSFNSYPHLENYKSGEMITYR